MTSSVYFIVLLLATCQFQSVHVAMTQRKGRCNLEAIPDDFSDAYYHKSMDTKELQKHRDIIDKAINNCEGSRTICNCRGHCRDTKEDMPIEEYSDEETPNEPRDPAIFFDAKDTGKTYALSKLEATVTDSTKPPQNALGKMLSERIGKNSFFRRSFYSTPEILPRSAKRLAIYAEFSGLGNDETNDEQNNQKSDNDKTEKPPVIPEKTIEFVGYPFLAEKYVKTPDEIEKDVKPSQKISTRKSIKIF